MECFYNRRFPTLHAVWAGSQQYLRLHKRRDPLRYVLGDSIETIKRETLVLHNDPGTDELSVEEMNLLNEVFENFKNYSFEDMKKFCHSLPEYDETVGAGSDPMRLGKCLVRLENQAEDMSHIAKTIIDMQRMKAVFGE